MEGSRDQGRLWHKLSLLLPAGTFKPAVAVLKRGVFS